MFPHVRGNNGKVSGWSVESMKAERSVDSSFISAKYSYKSFWSLK